MAWKGKRVHDTGNDCQNDAHCESRVLDGRRSTPRQFAIKFKVPRIALVIIAFGFWQFQLIQIRIIHGFCYHPRTDPHTHEIFSEETTD